MISDSESLISTGYEFSYCESKLTELSSDIDRNRCTQSL